MLRECIKRGIPVAVHESNAFPGVTVKMLGKEGAVVLLCSEDARRHLPEHGHVARLDHHHVLGVDAVDGRIIPHQPRLGRVQILGDHAHHPRLGLGN